MRWFREAHRLQPDNWTYKRQAWEFVDPILQGPSEQYEGDWLSDVRAIGARTTTRRSTFEEMLDPTTTHHG